MVLCQSLTKLYHCIEFSAMAVVSGAPQVCVSGKLNKR